MKKSNTPWQDDGPVVIRLNKFIANSGVGNRRDADQLILKGEIQVNGAVVKEMGRKVTLGRDIVTYKGTDLAGQQFVYILLNKPKNTMSVGSDPNGKPTVLDLCANATTERIFPVGQLDRESMGLILLTNDPEMSRRLVHPDHQVERLYHLVLDKTMKPSDIKKALKGVPLDDGLIKVDELRYVGDEEGPSMGMRISMNRKMVVKKLFEKLGYSIVKEDCVMFAGLTKKDLPRGRWRVLSERDVNFLRMATR